MTCEQLVEKQIGKQIIALGIRDAEVQVSKDNIYIRIGRKDYLEARARLKAKRASK